MTFRAWASYDERRGGLLGWSKTQAMGPMVALGLGSFEARGVIVTVSLGELERLSRRGVRAAT